MMRTVVFCALLFLMGCQKGSRDAWDSIGSVAGNDSITHIHITNFLKQHGIECTMAGSKTYGVMVRRNKTVQATALLKKDAPLRGYDFYFRDGTINKQSPIKVYAVHLSYAQVIKSSNPGFPTLLLSVLRMKEMAALARKLPIVTQFDVRRRDYMLSNGTLDTAYEGTVELSNQDQTAGSVQSFSVWEAGKRIYLQSLRGWLPRR